MVACLVGPSTLNAQTQSKDSPIELDPSGKSRLFLFRSDHFELYTDLEPRETIEVLDRIELVVSNLGVYWRQPLKGKIKCFVVSDLSVWSAELLSDANSRAKIAEQSGMIVGERVTKERGAESFRPVVYTFADAEMPQRQVVRAFCWQTFGRCGPDWFADGLAEVGAHWRKEGGIHCPPWMVEYLRNNASVSPRTIIDNQYQTNQHGRLRRNAGESVLCWRTIHARASGCVNSAAISFKGSRSISPNASQSLVLGWMPTIRSSSSGFQWNIATLLQLSTERLHAIVPMVVQCRLRFLTCYHGSQRGRRTDVC